jgi:HlyD family secretion protein
LLRRTFAYMSMFELAPYRSRRIALLAGAVTILSLIVWLLLRSNAPVAAARQAPPPPAMTVTASELQSVAIARVLSANGTIFPWQEVIIGPEVGGYRVKLVAVEVGDKVKRGQLLVSLADDMLGAEAVSRRANLQQAEATLQNAAAAARRARSLSVSGAMSQADLDKLHSEEVAAQARVQVARAELETAELKLRYTRVVAPDDGVVASRMVTPGQIAQTGGEMLRLIRQGRIEWRAEIPEARLRDIHIGQKVQLTLADGERVDGTVRTISPTVASNNRAGLVYVDIGSPNARPGMYARGAIVLGEGPARMAPLASVVIQDGYSYVFVVSEQNTVQRRRVETGTLQGPLIEIVSGVEPRERIVNKGAGFLKDGDRVSLVKADPGQGS